MIAIARNFQIISPAMRLVVKGLAELHRLIKMGKDDSPEADLVRDSLDIPLNALTIVEKERSRWLSEDLYSVSEPADDSTLKPMHSQAQRMLVEAYEAHQRHDDYRALDILRRWKEYISPALLSYLRGSIWFDLEGFEVAALFFEFAAEKDTSNDTYRALYVSALAKCSPSLAVDVAERFLNSDSSPIVVAHAASILFSATRSQSDAASNKRYQELIPVLVKNQVKLELVKSDSSYSSAIVINQSTLGFCYELIGKFSDALDCYSAGIAQSPNNDALLTARGILSYDSQRSISDFTRAIELGTLLIWPYFFVAHHYLIAGQFERCRELCGLARKLDGSHAVMSQIEEWFAIAQAELKYPRDLIDISFDTAIRLDPSNDLASQNYAAFAFASKSENPHLFTWKRKSADVVRQIGVAERRFQLPL